MAGHSKWSNIQHRKNRQDAKRSKVWTKIIHEVTLAAQSGGGDINCNPQLRIALDKAAAANIPKESTSRAVQRGRNKACKDIYTETRYEGYAPGGVAVMVDCVTSNHARTLSNVKQIFDKNKVKLGQEGSASFMFRCYRCFQFAMGISEERVISLALGLDIQDVSINEPGAVEAICLPSDYDSVRNGLTRLDIIPETERTVMKAVTEIQLSGEQATSIQKMLTELKNLDDVEEVYTNAILSIY